MNDYIEFVDAAQIKSERAKSREMKKSNWWKQQLGKGICYHCEKRFLKDQLTMDHLIPISRGGKSTKQNVVVSCLECNATKKHFTRAELVIMQMADDEVQNSQPRED